MGRRFLGSPTASDVAHSGPNMGSHNDLEKNDGHSRQSTGTEGPSTLLHFTPKGEEMFQQVIQSKGGSSKWRNLGALANTGGLKHDDHSPLGGINVSHRSGKSRVQAHGEALKVESRSGRSVARGASKRPLSEVQASHEEQYSNSASQGGRSEVASSITDESAEEAREAALASLRSRLSNMPLQRKGVALLHYDDILEILEAHGIDVATLDPDTVNLVQTIVNEAAQEIVLDVCSQKKQRIAASKHLSISAPDVQTAVSSLAEGSKTRHPSTSRFYTYVNSCSEVLGRLDPDSTEVRDSIVARRENPVGRNKKKRKSSGGPVSTINPAPSSAPSHGVSSLSVNGAAATGNTNNNTQAPYQDAQMLISFSKTAFAQPNSSTSADLGMNFIHNSFISRHNSVNPAFEAPFRSKTLSAKAPPSPHSVSGGSVRTIKGSLKSSSHQEVSQSRESLRAALDTLRQEMRVVEFYSGIGGHHAALKLALEATQDDGQSIHSKNSSITESRDESNDKFNVVRAFDMSEHAQATYEHYWKSPKVSRRNILFLKPELGVEYDELCHADLFIMSPPCQPYSRRKQKKHSQAPDRSGQEDRRAWSLHHLIERMQNDDDFLPRLLLLENVLGFENSESFEKLTAMFDARGFTWQAIVLSPHMLGIPNSRPRLFVLAKRNSSFAIPQWTNQVIQETETDPERRQAQTDNAQEHIFWVDQGSILKSILSDAGVSGDNIIPRESGALCPVRDFLEHNMSDEDRATFGIDPVVLWKAGNYFDVITPSSLRSSCFTKSYAYFHGGAGSVICNDLSAQEIQQVYEKFFTERNAIIEAAEPNKPNWKQVVEERGGCPTLESLKLRYFMPHEIARLLGFPEDFAFHPESSLRQRYALLGNSLSVHNVALLLRYLVAEPKLTNTDTQS